MSQLLMTQQKICHYLQEKATPVGKTDHRRTKTIFRTRPILSTIQVILHQALRRNDCFD